MFWSVSVYASLGQHGGPICSPRNPAVTVAHSPLLWIGSVICNKQTCWLPAHSLDTPSPWSNLLVSKLGKLDQLIVSWVIWIKSLTTMTSNFQLFHSKLILVNDGRGISLWNCRQMTGLHLKLCPTIQDTVKIPKIKTSDRSYFYLNCPTGQVQIAYSCALFANKDRYGIVGDRWTCIATCPTGQAVPKVKIEPWMNFTGLYWYVNIGSGNGLVPSGNKPLLVPAPMLTKIPDTIWPH